MTSAEEITRLLAERNAPVMDIADIGYDFVGRLLENNLAHAVQERVLGQDPGPFKDTDGRWAVAYWGAISFLVNTDKVKMLPETWNDLSSPITRTWSAAATRASRPTRRPPSSPPPTPTAAAKATSSPGSTGSRQLRDTGNLRKGVVLNVASVQKGECPISLVYDFDGFAKRDATGPAAQGDHPEGRRPSACSSRSTSAPWRPIRTRPRWPFDFFFSDEGQVLLAQGYAHPSRKVTLPADVAAKMLPESAYAKIHFPTSLPAFSAAIKKIVDGWNAIVGQ